MYPVSLLSSEFIVCNSNRGHFVPTAQPLPVVPATSNRYLVPRRRQYRFCNKLSYSQLYKNIARRIFLQNYYRCADKSLARPTSLGTVRASCGGSRAVNCGLVGDAWWPCLCRRCVKTVRSKWRSWEFLYVRRTFGKMFSSGIGRQRTAARVSRSSSETAVECGVGVTLCWVLLAVRVGFRIAETEVNLNCI